MVYVANLILILGYNFFLNMTMLSRQRKKALFLILCVIQITVIIGTRTVDSGIDTYNYYNVYRRLKYADHPFADAGLYNLESLYICLSWLIVRMGGSFTFLNLVMAAITMIFLAKAIYRLSSSALFSIYLFISFCLMYQMTNQYRQILSLTIILYAFSYLLEGNRLKYILLVILAAGFHISSLVMLPAMFLTNVKLNRKTVLIYAFSGVGLWFFGDVLMYLLSFTPYANYVGSWIDVEFTPSAILNFGVRLILLIFCGLFYGRLKNVRPDVDFYYHLALICTVLQFMTIRSGLFGRITTYFFAGYLILIPEIVVNGYRILKNKVLVNSALFLVFMLWHYVYYIQNNFAYTSVLLN